MTTSNLRSGHLDSSLEAALLAGGPQPVAPFSLDVLTGRWTWSPGVYAMHGFEPGEVVPTTALMLAHKHPQDRSRVEGVLDKVCRTGAPFSCMHRIVDARGRTRTLGVVGRGRVDPRTDVVVTVSGYFIDLTEAQRALAMEQATEAIRASAANRETIEQAKGAVMVLYGLTAQEAFELLCHYSSITNEPVRSLSRRLLARLAGGPARTSSTHDDLDHFFASSPSMR